MTPKTLPPEPRDSRQAAKDICAYIASLILTAAACFLLATTH